MITERNARRDWVPSIPVPFYRWLRYQCIHGFAGEGVCERKFWTLDGYRGHFALDHILYPIWPDSRMI